MKSWLREFLAVAGTLMSAVAGTAAIMSAEQTRAEPVLPRVVWLYQTFGFGDAKERLRGYLGSNGLVDGRNITLQFHELGAGETDYGAIAATRPAVIVSIAHEGLPDLIKRVRDIPIVFYNLGRDPVTLGFVSSLQRPGGNVTGTTIGIDELEGKRWEVLKELVPGLKRGAQLVDKKAIDDAHERAARDPDIARIVKAAYANTAAVGARLGIEIAWLGIASDASAREIGSLVREARVQALVVDMSTPALKAYLKESRIPAMGGDFRSVRNGMLVGSSFDFNEGEAYAARAVARILRGESPATIPVYRTRNIGFAVNKTTAREMGIEIPPTLLVRALEVFE
jgi:putative ABC transport system substrate-binding protein